MGRRKRRWGARAWLTLDASPQQGDIELDSGGLRYRMDPLTRHFVGASLTVDCVGGRFQINGDRLYSC